MSNVVQLLAIDLVRLGGVSWRVAREGFEDRVFDDWDEAYAYFEGDPELRVARTLRAEPI